MYGTAAAVRAYATQYGLSLGSITDAGIVELLGISSDEIDATCSDHFALSTLTLNVDGMGHAALYLLGATYLVCLSLTSVTDTENSVTYTLADIVNKGHFLVIKTETADDPRVLSEGVFPYGNSNIQVVGSFGWVSTPAAITRAAIILATIAITEDPSAVAFESETFADYSYRRAKSEGTAGDFPILEYPAIRRLLEGGDFIKDIIYPMTQREGQAVSWIESAEDIP